MQLKDNQPKSQAPKTVDEYLANLPGERRRILEQLRKTIKTAAPNATEIISYQIPVYKYGGRPLVGFASFKNHHGFYLMSFAVMKAHQSEVKDYRSSKFTLQFRVDEPVPLALVRKLVKARVVEVDLRVRKIATKSKKAKR